MPGSRGDVLIVEDSSDAAELFTEIVEREGFRAIVCSSAGEGLAAFERAKPVAVILDWTLPDEPGIEVCRKIRSRDQVTPVIFASARNDETSIARGLDAGADDYIAKPVRAGELIARLEAHLRRIDILREQLAQSPETVHVVNATRSFGKVEVDLVARRVSVGGEAIGLGPMEFRLLEYLVRNVGAAVSRDQIMSEVYGYDADIGTARVDLLVKRLRAKLSDHAEGGLITAVPGYGYRLERRARSE
jgi:two-component system phosphate regulon response regulator PhoB